MKNKLKEEKKYLKVWHPQVKLLINKINHPLPMSKKYTRKCTNIASLWDEYYEKHEQSGGEENTKIMSSDGYLS